MAHELLTVLSKTNLYLLYVVLPPAYMGLLFTGGMRRAYQARPTWYWTGFLFWMAVATPFSVWRGGSARLFYTFVRTEFPMLLIVAGLALTWTECRRLIHVIALSAICFLSMATLFARHDEARITLLFGSTANPNDLAAHYMLVLPFLIFLALDGNKWKILRLAALVATGIGLSQILGTGSRGALVALAATFLFALIFGTGWLRLGVALFAGVALVLTPLFLPKETSQRLKTFSSVEGSGEAVESLALRRELLSRGMGMTLRNPVFGEGPGQFEVADNIVSREAGALRGLWRNTHNVYLKISAECGIPALILYLAGIISSFLLLRKTYARARHDPRFRQIGTAAFCIMISLVGFCVAVAFLNMAYSFYLPAMAGLAIAVSRAAEREFAVAEANAAATPAGPVRIPPTPQWQITLAARSKTRQ